MSRPIRLALALALSALPLATRATARAGEDAEKAAHGDEASTPQTTLDVESGGVRLRQYQLGCLSQLTYLVASRGEALVVDPQRDVGHYQRDAKALGAKITHVFLTHTNADFVAGHTELARAGAKVHISAQSGSKFPHDGLVDGTKVSVGDATIEAIATPGHTPDSMTLLLHVPGASVDPLAAFTGDALFIGGIGRPDLVGGDTTPMRLASMAFDSMARLVRLPDATQVLPAHGAGSLCGAHLSPETVSTIGREKETNPYLRPMSRAQFVSRVVSGLPVAPAYFKFNVAINRAGPPVIEGAPAKPPALAPADFDAKRREGAWIVDLRDAGAYAAGHVEGAVHIAIRGRLDTWTGIVIPFDAPLLLVGTDAEVGEATFRFRRIGIDTVAGHLDGGMDAWKAAGLPVRTTEVWSPARLHDAIASHTEPVLVDVRTEGEAAELRIGDYANLPLSDWERFAKVLDPKAPVVFVCNSAYRSSMAVGLAERLGFTTIGSLEGGVDAWLTAKLPVLGTATRDGVVCQGPVCKLPAPSDAGPAARSGSDSVSGAGFLLPEAVAAASLASGLSGQPSSYAVLDVRPGWAFDEYHVPGATRVEVDRIVEHVRAIPTATRIVVVDRDGTTAWSVAGMLAATFPGRSIRVLVGGTAQYWHDVETGGEPPAGPPAAGAAREPARAGPAPVAPSTPAPAPAPAAPPVKRRPAGC